MSGPIQQSQASVGLLLGIRENGQPGVLLQERAEHDSYARACQVTTHGKLSADEMKLDESLALPTALGRKLREELGEIAAQMIEAAQAAPIELERIVNSKGRLVVTYGLDLAEEASAFRKLIVPGVDVGGFRVCLDPSTIEPLEDDHKAAGVAATETRMFKDEIESVKAFFRVFNNM